MFIVRLNGQDSWAKPIVARHIREVGSSRNSGLRKCKADRKLSNPSVRILLRENQFGRRTLEGVLRQIERWKEFLKSDFMLPVNQRTEIIQRIKQTELLVGNALIQVNSPRVGDWELRYEWIPTGRDESGNSVYIRPALRITARHRDTGEIRQASIPHEPSDASDLGANPFKTAFDELGLWEQLGKGSPRVATWFPPEGPRVGRCTLR
jgi:hypothetical protein